MRRTSSSTHVHTQSHCVARKINSNFNLQTRQPKNDANNTRNWLCRSLRVHLHKNVSLLFWLAPQLMNTNKYANEMSMSVFQMTTSVLETRIDLLYFRIIQSATAAIIVATNMFLLLFSFFLCEEPAIQMTFSTVSSLLSNTKLNR